jgi:tumor protein p53-inducible protein 3
MKAVQMSSFGGPEVLYIGEVPDLSPEADELLVRIHATALNRADLLQRKGLYPPPAGASDVLGLEMAGEVVAVGEDCRGWQRGDRVCALLPGGGYAQFAKIPAGMAMKLPDSMSYEEGAAIPEVFLTAYLNLFTLGHLELGQTVLVHAGASGVGTAAIQLIREAGGQSIVTAGSSTKIERCLELGAQSGWNYNDGPFAPWVQAQTGGRGVDIILDFVGAAYFDQNIQSLAVDGRLIVIGTMGGVKVESLNLGHLLSRRLQVIGTALRSRSSEEKMQLTRDFMNFAWLRMAQGQIKPVLDTVYDWTEVAKAHQYMADNKNTGKIVLRIPE